MEQTSTMEKKNQLRAFTVCSKGNQDSKSIDISNKKNGSQYPRKRDNEKVDSNRKPLYNRGGRSCQRYVRPREKVDKQVESQDSKSEFGSLQRSGGRKQTISHLFNWWGPAPYEKISNKGPSNRGYVGGSGKRNFIPHPKYNKEHFLQANCQFVVSFGNDYSSYEKNPDQLVEWDYVQEVRLHMSESPSCPICLFSPIAAKVTRCGHIFCYSCILHYLALSDEKWRKCPICFDAISKDDLKSVQAILHKNYGCGEEIELELMRRDRDSLIPIPVSQYSTSMMKRVAVLSDPSPISRHSKLVVATSEEVTKYIVARELEDLQKQFKDEESEPEACFIEAAIELVTVRLSSLTSQKLIGSKVKNENAQYCELDLLNNFQCEANLAEMDYEPECIKSNDEELNKGFQELSLCQSNDNLESGTHSSIESVSPTDVMPILDLKDLDISHFQTSASKNQLDVRGPKATYFFYQESSGSNIFLHALNVHMLINEYGSLENCPKLIKAKVLEKETASMTEELRQRLRYLRHLPRTCPFEVVEIELNVPLISQLTINEFQGQLENRLRKRRKKAKEEHRIEKRVQVEEDKMMGRSRGSSINMYSFKHFPTFAEDLHTHFEEDVNTNIPFASSPQSCSEEFPTMSPPSFAQIINRPGNRVESRESDLSSSSLSTFPSLGATSDQPKNYQPTAKGRPNKSFGSDEDEDEGERVPNFQLAFSNAFDKALNEAKIASNFDGANATPQRGKKGRKKKGIVLLSSGGHH